MPPEKTCKPRAAPSTPFARAERKPKPATDAPCTSAKPATDMRRKNLTLHDWLTVFAFCDTHTDMMQQEISSHFKGLKTGALVFSQETLSRKIAMRSELEQRANSNPNALSMTRERIVTRPDVERALVLWVEHMVEEKGETVTGDMLIEKRVRFEKQFDVPEELLYTEPKEEREERVRNRNRKPDDRNFRKVYGRITQAPQDSRMCALPLPVKE
ncbi:hypothetical protein B0H10DRAFT_1787859 [Mycena sp. CBHHK59/15]|nr:hypothetical protein B0H10DRAFT_1787859 [Mycena sp. CBHHK59/15]